MNFLGKYSNSIGHLIMSICMIAAGTILVLISTDGLIRGLGVFLINTAVGYWFVSSAAAHNGGGNNLPPPNATP